MTFVDFKSEDDVKEYLENIGIEYRFGCFSEKNSESCHLLGDYLETVKRDFPKAFSVYNNNCEEMNFGRSCMKAGNYHFLGKGIPRNLSKAYDMYVKACYAGDGQSCLNSGLMCISNSKDLESIPKDHAMGLKLLNKACDAGNAYSCFYLSGIYIKGMNDKLSKDMKTAFGYASRACDLGNILSCANVSQMLAKGEGVEKDLEKSEAVKKRAAQLHREAQGGVPSNV